MADNIPALAGDPPGISEAALKKAEEFIEADEGALNRLSGTAGNVATTVAVVMSLFHLYAAIAGAWPFHDFPIIATQPLRYAHVAFVLVLSFLLFPMATRFRNRIRWWDVVLGADRRRHPDLRHRGRRRFHRPRHLADPARHRARRHLHRAAARGDAAHHRLDRAGRSRSAFLAYAYFGPYLPQPWTHRGFDVGQLVGHLFITLEGIFGVPVDVSSSLIILFTIYGAFLQHSGAGKFFIDFSMALMGSKPNSAGRTVVLSSFLLGGPSGSGVATTVTIGAVAYPMMERAGFEKNAAGGLLAAGGLGAIISPPVLGAAAFLIAEFLKISYLDVIWMATIPTLPLLPFAAVHGRARRASKFGMRASSTPRQDLSLWQLTSATASTSCR